MARATKLLLVGTFLLIALGGVVTSTESGMADPHWPSFEGELAPSIERMKENRGLLFEHTHRVVAGLVAIFTCGLAVAIRARDRRKSVRRLGWSAAGLVLLIALLGGATVLFNTPPEISVVHVSLAMLFLSLVTSLAVVYGRKWQPGRVSLLGGDADDARWLRGGAIACAATVYLQIILGAVLRHAYEGVMLHVIWAFAVFTAVVMVVARVFSRHGKALEVVMPGLLLAVLVLAQFFLGFTAFVSRPDGVDDAGSHLHQAVASSHQIIGAAMMVASVVFLLRVFRCSYVAARSELPAKESAAYTETPLDPRGEGLECAAEGGTGS